MTCILKNQNNPNMSTTLPKEKAPKITAGNDSIFFAGQYPEWMKAKTDLEWVKYMNKKYGFKWTGRDSK
jgi:hypothetical protein